MCRSTRARWELAAAYVATLQHNVFSMHPTCISGIGWRMLTSIQRIHSQSPDFYNKESSATAPKATDIMVTHGFTGTLNMSQQIDRMGVSELRAPCVTPKAFLWNFCEKRPFTGIDKLMFQCFPVDNMKLTCLDEPVASQHVVAKKIWHWMICSKWDMCIILGLISWTMAVHFFPLMLSALWN